MMLASVLVLAAGALAQSNAVMRIDDLAVFKDTNRAGIQYTPGWVAQDDVGARYHGSYTVTQLPGSFALINFRGTGIGYYADRSSTSGPVALALDGNRYPDINSTGMSIMTTYAQRMWGIENLAPGDHQLVIGSMNSFVNNSGPVGLDYFAVTPIGEDQSYVPQWLGPGAYNVPVNATIIDQEHPAITYNGLWNILGHDSVGPSPIYFNNTERASTRPGDSCTFTFAGTAVYYFSDAYSGNAPVSMSIDGQPGDIVNTSLGANWISQRMFWSRSGLDDGVHTLTITHVGAQGQYANLDFFMIVPGDTPQPAIHHRSAPIAAIIGGVVGGVVGLALILVAGFMFWRKRRAAVPDQETAPAKDTKVDVHVVTLHTVGSDTSIDEKVNEDKAIA